MRTPRRSCARKLEKRPPRRRLPRRGWGQRTPVACPGGSLMGYTRNSIACLAFLALTRHCAPFPTSGCAGGGVCVCVVHAHVHACAAHVYDAQLTFSARILRAVDFRRLCCDRAARASCQSLARLFRQSAIPLPSIRLGRFSLIPPAFPITPIPFPLNGSPDRHTVIHTLLGTPTASDFAR